MEHKNVSTLFRSSKNISFTHDLKMMARTGNRVEKVFLLEVVHGSVWRVFLQIMAQLHDI